MVVEYRECRNRVADFYRDHRLSRESKEDLFLRHMPTNAPRQGEFPMKSGYGAMLSNELCRITQRQQLEHIAEVADEMNIPALCATHTLFAPDAHIGQYVAEQHGITEFHPNVDVPHTIQSPLNQQLYLEIFHVAVAELLFNKANLRIQGTFDNIMQIAEYAARGVAAGYLDFSRDHLRSEWQMVADHLPDVIAAYDVAPERKARLQLSVNREPHAPTQEDPDWIKQRDAFMNKDKKRKW